MQAGGTGWPYDSAFRAGLMGKVGLQSERLWSMTTSHPTTACVSSCWSSMAMMTACFGVVCYRKKLFDCETSPVAGSMKPAEGTAWFILSYGHVACDAA
ncbi:hypothetical protein BAUCODRAFT_34859 [Baudoinia panamericana UAMH 10762]|uniref:Uncharacterized protein n=1 Tax=Baudoinia panamericana (strain UAMH 10762) TaxID=717646 RepID=M2LNY1_BAUPA|nr:uncharacterized protein BAUCODRAFT_34859 [Baudoinia panamericana UAMH 10762]EMC96082.1 hypothetical protein BAUCODRAFT_34859 [Baudoinia panamericana UAMH 10762]